MLWGLSSDAGPRRLSWARGGEGRSEVHDTFAVGPPSLLVYSLTSPGAYQVLNNVECGIAGSVQEPSSALGEPSLRWWTVDDTRAFLENDSRDNVPTSESIV